MKRKVIVPLQDDSGARVGYKELENGNMEIAVLRGTEVLIYELPKDVWEKIKQQGFVELVKS